MPAVYQKTLEIGSYIDNLEITKVLSMSAYGQIYLARDPITFKRYAIKSLLHTGLESHQIAFQRNEITLHSHLSDHPRIIRLEKVVRTPEWTHAVLEYGSEGDLFSAITEQNIYYGNHALIKHVFLQLIEAVRHCHEKHIFHRDLKPENILVFDKGHTLKLADFGLATTEMISNDFGCGSTFYFSPECQGGLDRQKRSGYATAPNDVWALGVILINLAAGRNPWCQASLDDDTFCAYLSDPNLLLKILPVSQELNQILKRIFCIDPLRRITLDELYTRIKNCKHFTRTPEVAKFELTRLRQRLPKKLDIKKAAPKPTLTIKTTTELPSPPDTPQNLSASSSLTNDNVFYSPNKVEDPDPIMKSMVTLVV